MATLRFQKNRFLNYNFIALLILHIVLIFGHEALEVNILFRSSKMEIEPSFMLLYAMIKQSVTFYWSVQYLLLDKFESNKYYHMLIHSHINIYML